MQYISTRGESEAVEPTVMLTHTYTEFGGLFAPTALPTLSYERLVELADYDLRYRLTAVLHLFLTDLTWQRLYNCIDLVFNKLQIDPESEANTNLLNPYNQSVILTNLCFGQTKSWEEFTLALYLELLEAYGVDPDISVVTYGNNLVTSASAAIFGASKRKCIALSSIKKTANTFANCPIETTSYVGYGLKNPHYTLIESLRTLETTTAWQEANLLLFTPAHTLTLLVQVAFAFASVSSAYKNEWLQQRSAVHWMVPEGDGTFTAALWYAAQMGIPMQRIVICGRKGLKLQHLFQLGKYSFSEGSTNEAKGLAIAEPAEHFERIVFDVAEKNQKTMASYLDSDGMGYKLPTHVVGQLRHIFAWSVEATSEQAKQQILQLYDQTDFAFDDATALAISHFFHLQRKSHSKKNDNVCVVPLLFYPLNNTPNLAAALRGSGYAKGRSPEKLLAEMATETGLTEPDTAKWEYRTAILANEATETDFCDLSALAPLLG